MQAASSGFSQFTTIFSTYDKTKYVYYDTLPSKWNSCVREYILFNGNNALSIALADYDDAYTNNNFLNYNLTTGKKIKIEELFTKDFNVVEAFTKTLYRQLGEGEITWDEQYYYDEISGEEYWWRF